MAAGRRWGFARGAPRVGVLRLEGPVAARSRFRRGISLESFGPAIERAFRMRRLKAVALVVNSPGGSPAQSALVHDRIRTLAAERRVPVFAFIEDVAASGGYWLACAGDEIYAQPSSVIGSIGVIYSGFGFVEALAKLGVERRLHTAGDNKAVLDPFLPEKPEDLARLDAMQKDIHEVFMAHVRERRGSRLNDVDDDLFSGAFWTGEAARRRGLIDGFGDVRGVMRARFTDRVQLRPVTTERGLARRLGMGAGGDRLRDLADEVESRALWSRFGL